MNYLSTFFVVFLVPLNAYNHITTLKRTKGDINFVNGYYHEYLNARSNIRIKIRKLSDPKNYPFAKVYSIVNKLFGSITKRQRAYSESGRGVCEVVFENNYRHRQYLKQTEHKYNTCEWRVMFLTKPAVSDHDAMNRLYNDQGYKSLE